MIYAGAINRDHVPDDRDASEYIGIESCGAAGACTEPHRVVMRPTSV